MIYTTSSNISYQRIVFINNVLLKWILLSKWKNITGDICERYIDLNGYKLLKDNLLKQFQNF